MRACRRPCASTCCHKCMPSSSTSHLRLLPRLCAPRHVKARGGRGGGGTAAQVKSGGRTRDLLGKHSNLTRVCSIQLQLDTGRAKAHVPLPQRLERHFFHAYPLPLHNSPPPRRRLRAQMRPGRRTCGTSRVHARDQQAQNRAHSRKRPGSSPRGKARSKNRDLLRRCRLS